jgi:hypothetical protein
MILLLLKLTGIVLILYGLKGLVSTANDIWKKKLRFKFDMFTILKNGYYFITGCFFLILPNLEIKTYQLYFLGALYFGVSTILWFFIIRLDKDN